MQRVPLSLGYLVSADAATTWISVPVTEPVRSIGLDGSRNAIPLDVTTADPEPRDTVPPHVQSLASRVLDVPRDTRVLHPGRTLVLDRPVSTVWVRPALGSNPPDERFQGVLLDWPVSPDVGNVATHAPWASFSDYGRNGTLSLVFNGNVCSPLHHPSALVVPATDAATGMGPLGTEGGWVKSQSLTVQAPHRFVSHGVLSRYSRARLVVELFPNNPAGSCASTLVVSYTQSRLLRLWLGAQLVGANHLEYSLDLGSPAELLRVLSPSGLTLVSATPEDVWYRVFWVLDRAESFRGLARTSLQLFNVTPASALHLYTLGANVDSTWTDTGATVGPVTVLVPGTTAGTVATLGAAAVAGQGGGGCAVIPSNSQLQLAVGAGSTGLTWCVQATGVVL